MSIWAALVAIVGIIAFVQVVKYRTGHGPTPPAMDQEGPIVRENVELKREVEDLRERIKVLERIATEDRGAKRLSEEIEALRANKIEEGSKQ
jgi:hypothetical protein